MPDLIEQFAQVSLFADDAKISRYVANKDDSIRLQEALEILYMQLVGRMTFETKYFKM